MLHRWNERTFPQKLAIIGTSAGAAAPFFVSLDFSLGRRIAIALMAGAMSYAAGILLRR